MTKQISVLIVDDSLSVRTAFSAMVKADPGLTLFATAHDPFVAAEHMRRQLPDAILLDIEMPRMDGLTFLKKIMDQCPVPVIVCSSHSHEGSIAAMKALDLGAAQVIAKPDLSTSEARARAALKIGQALRVAVGEKAAEAPKGEMSERGRNDERLSPDVILPRKPYIRPRTTQSLVAIGSSTGGPEALSKVIGGLAAHAPAIAIVQHMPAEFTGSLARRLNGLAQIEVREAQDGDKLTPGLALVAPGDRHLVIHPDGYGYRVEVLGGPYVSRHRPSVDVLFRSAAQAAGHNAMGVILTGMGDDGADCLGEIKQAGGHTVAQDEASCVVYGMPRAAAERGAANKVMDITAIPREIMRWHDGSVRKTG